MRLSIRSNDAGAVHGKDDMEVLHTHVLENLVVGSLEK